MRSIPRGFAESDIPAELDVSAESDTPAAENSPVMATCWGWSHEFEVATGVCVIISHQYVGLTPLST